MTVEEFLKVLKALDIDPSSSLDDAMAKIKGGEPADEKKPEDKPEEKPADKPADPVAAAMPEEKPEEVGAALSAIRSLSGKASFVSSVADIRTWHTSHVELAAERQKLAEREALLEGAERRKLCVELVTLAGRAPATVWATSDKDSAPKPYLVSMPIADLRAMHADEIRANGKRPPAAVPPAGAAPAQIGEVKTFNVTALDGKPITVTLDARERKIADDAKCSHETFAMLKARRNPTAA